VQARLARPGLGSDADPSKEHRISRVGAQGFQERVGAEVDERGEVPLHVIEERSGYRLQRT
jgi:hypothetical protein